MITLTRPNGRPVLLNCDLIETIDEGEGGTVIALTTGNAVVVNEPMTVVEAKVVAFKRKIYGQPSC